MIGDDEIDGLKEQRSRLTQELELMKESRDKLAEEVKEMHRIKLDWESSAAIAMADRDAWKKQAEEYERMLYQCRGYLEAKRSLNPTHEGTALLLKSVSDVIAKHAAQRQGEGK